MAEFPILQFSTDAFIADTPHLDATETGAYLMLLFCAWRSPDCSLPNDDKKLARMARCNMRVWHRIKDDVMAFWTLDELGQWNQKRLQLERLRVTQRSQLAKQSAQAKWLKHNNTGDAVAVETHMRNGCERYANQNQNQEEDKKEGNSSELLVKPNGFDPHPKPEKFPIQDAFDNYNIAASALGLPIAEKLTADRKRKLRLRLKEHGLDGWNRALEFLDGSAFLKGDNGRGWRPTIDFLLQPTSLVKLMEGGYADGRD